MCQVLFFPGRENDWVVWMSEQVFTEEDREMGNSLELYRKETSVKDPQCAGVIRRWIWKREQRPENEEPFKPCFRSQASAFRGDIRGFILEGDNIIFLLYKDVSGN